MLNSTEKGSLKINSVSRAFPTFFSLYGNKIFFCLVFFKLCYFVALVVIAFLIIIGNIREQNEIEDKIQECYQFLEEHESPTN